MSTVTLLIAVEESSLGAVENTLQSLVHQTHQDWEVVFLLDIKDQFLQDPLEGVIKKIGVEDECDLLFHHNSSSLQAINLQLESFGDWVGFLTAGDCLHSSALENLLEGVDPEAVIAYCDNEHVSRWGYISYHNNKPPVNPYRLLFQNYLADPMLIDGEWLKAHRFDERATDDPTHDVVLRVLEQRGTKGFHHYRGRCLQKFRDSFRVEEDPRKLPYVSPYDLHAIKMALHRRGIEGVVQQAYGVVDIQYINKMTPSIQVVCFVDDVIDFGKAVIKSLIEDKIYPDMLVRVVYRGEDETVAAFYKKTCSDASIHFEWTNEAEPAILNRITRTTNQKAVLVLKAIPLGQDWLRELGHLLTLGFGAVTGRFIKLNRLTFPGTPGWKYEGAHWNHRGSFGELTTPYQVSVMGPEAFLYDVHEWHRIGVFEESLPIYYVADWTMRANRDGVKTPVHTGVSFITNAPVASEDELRVLKGMWADWEDPYELHRFV